METSIIRVVPVLLLAGFVVACGGKNKYDETDTGEDSDVVGDVETDTDIDSIDDPLPDSGDDVPVDSPVDSEEDVPVDSEEDVPEDVPVDSPLDTVEDVPADTMTDAPADTVEEDASTGCTADIDCDDDDDCTLDSCDLADGTCDHVVDVGADCNDFDDCTVDDECDSSGVCGGDPVTCGGSYPCPTADAGSDVTVDAEGSFSLDGSGTTYSGTGPLTWDWVGEAGAPALTDADTQTPDGVATVCGTFTYTLTVTEQCGLESTDTVVLNVDANGPYVSNTTCDVSMQCGTIAYPWCTIQNGIDGTASSPVMVAGVAGNPYPEAVDMADGIDVYGGYEPTFTALRDVDPTTNETRIELQSGSVTWPAATEAVLDAFTVRLVDSSGSITPDRTHVVADGSATVGLFNDRLDAVLTLPVSDSVMGVAMGGGSGGDLEIESIIIDLPPANVSSTGIMAAPAYDGDITVYQADIVLDSAVIINGIRHLGPGVLTIIDADIRPGSGDTTTRGVQANHSSAQVYIDISSIRSGFANNSYAADISGVSLVNIDGGSFLGQGGTGVGATRSVGIRLASVGSATIDGANLRGSMPASAGSMPLGIGLLLEGAGDTVPGPVVVTDCTIRGGEFATERYGIHSNGIPLTVQSSDVAGSNGAGGSLVAGIHLEGITPGIEVQILGNTSIIGGQPASGLAGTTYEAYGIQSHGTIPVIIDGNTLIQGCSPECTGPGMSVMNQSIGAGVWLSDGSGHSITGNASILGGPHAGTGTFTNHAGILGGFSNGIASTATTLTVVDNDAIQGNVDPAQRPETASGMLMRDVDVTVQFSRRVFGGYATDSATGVTVLARTVGANNAVIEDSALLGGAALTTAGLNVGGTDITADRNLIDACGLASSSSVAPPAECLLAERSFGVYANDNPTLHLHNNYVFGGFGASAAGCDIAPPGSMSSTTVRTVLVYNLCLAQGQAAGAGGTSEAVGLRLWYFSGLASDNYYSDNIFGAGEVAMHRYATQEGEALSSIYYHANDFIPDSTTDAFVAHYMHTTLGELDTPAAVNALVDYAGNVSVDPLFAAPNPSSPTAAGYHLDGTCALANLGELSPWERQDFDLEMRDDGSTDWPEMGPDECH